MKHFADQHRQTADPVVTYQDVGVLSSQELAICSICPYTTVDNFTTPVALCYIRNPEKSHYLGRHSRQTHDYHSMIPLGDR